MAYKTFHKDKLLPYKGNYITPNQLYVIKEFQNFKQCQGDVFAYKIACTLGWSACVVDQRPCNISDTIGVYARNFELIDEAKFVSLNMLMEKRKVGIPDGFQYASFESRFNWMVDTICRLTDLPINAIQDYLIRLYVLDILVGNRTRTFDTIGTMFGIRGFRVAPIFNFNNAFSNDPFEDFKESPIEVYKFLCSVKTNLHRGILCCMSDLEKLRTCTYLPSGLNGRIYYVNILKETKKL